MGESSSAIEPTRKAADGRLRRQFAADDLRFVADMSAMTLTAARNGSTASPRPGEPQVPVAFWPHPAVIAPNNFVYKSLSNWSFNIAVGCSHGCTFCYVPNAATIKQGAALAPFGVDDPDAQWGEYVLLREWDEK